MKRYRKTLYRLSLTVLIISLSAISSCIKDEGPAIPKAPASVPLSEGIFYKINLNDRSGDTFKVRAFVDGLTEDNAIFQFAATVPGTYSIHNFGDYVTSFKVFDKNYKLLEAEKISPNQWKLNNPGETHIIEYEIAETWDDPAPENFIYKMAGTSIEDDHTLLNTFGVIGYPAGQKDKDIYLELKYPDSWSIGTALPLNPEGFYVAEDFDHLADSPLLLGSISNAKENISNATIDVWVYSKFGNIHATEISNAISQVLIDAEAFLGELPVDHYSFLYHFGEFHSGALEHSYSSVYVLFDATLSQSYAASIKDIAAHEFFHIVTPLNIHSEIIKDFNFVTPTPSAHLWFYEGVTEWASDFMQFRNNSITIHSLFDRLKEKIEINEKFDPNFSLTDISLQSYAKEGSEQFVNIYNRGALVAALLDIKLLELSDGSYGLQELILELLGHYGKNNAFQDDEFFDTIVAMTYPEIEDFINNYISGTVSLPIKEYFLKLGIQYNAQTKEFLLLERPSTEQALLFAKWSINQ